MSLLDYNAALLSREKKELECPLVTDDVINTFKEFLLYNMSIKAMFDTYDDAASLYTQYPGILKVIPKKLATDVYYAVKMGQYYPGVPNKLVYILHTTYTRLADGKFPNLTLSKCLNAIKQYGDRVYVSEVGRYDTKDVLNNVCGHDVRLITADSLKAEVANAVEVYVEAIDKVVILPKDMADGLNNEDCRNIKWSSTQGLSINGILLRQMNQRVGLTRKDYDLREAL